MIELIARPEKFSGLLIRTEGLAVTEFENVALYLSASDAEHLIARNALALDFSNANITKETRQNISGHYVVIEARFRPPRTDESSSPAYRGTLHEIERVVRKY
jgi:hypothetical protein